MRRTWCALTSRALSAAEWTNRVLSEELKKHERAAIPFRLLRRFSDGSVRTFSRGGSDISGALVARAAEAELYENWTDVSGFLMADPRVVKESRRHRAPHLPRTARAFLLGATVLHEDAIFPVHKAGIPTNIRNTNDPNHPGTMIVDKAKDVQYRYPSPASPATRTFPSSPSKRR